MNMIKKKKRTTKDTPPEIRRIGVLLEAVDHKVDLLVEGQQALSARIDRLEQRINELSREMDYRFKVILDELELIRNDLKIKVDHKEFLILERRVAEIERRLSQKK